MAKHTVKQGECISSIADEYGFFWETLWNLPENVELKTKCKNPNVIFPGDEVFVPEKKEKLESGATEQRHRFRKKGVPAKIRIGLVDGNGKPRANLQYTLEIDGKLVSGKTDGDGKIELAIPPNAKSGILHLGADGDETLRLNLGNTDPVSEISGVKARLTNLGFSCGEIDGQKTPELESALQAFQKKHGLDVTGKPDEPTRKKLEDLHGS